MNKLYLLLVILFFLVTCSNSKSKNKISEKKTSEVNISATTASKIPSGIQGRTIKMTLIKQWGTGTHMVTHINGVKAEAARYGIDISVVDANHDLQKMSEGISTAIANKVDAILLSHGKSGALKEAVKEALRANIPIIAFDVDFNIASSIAQGRLVSLDQNDLMMGLMSLSKMVEELDGSGNIIYNRVAGITPTDKRHRIWEGAIVPTYPGVKVVATIDQGTDGAMEKAQSAMEAALIANKNVDAVFAVWDEYAKGFYNAIVQSKKIIPIFSIDISDQDLAMMQSRPDIWKASAAVDPTIVGQVQVRLALKALAGEKIPRYYSLKPVLIHVDDLPSIEERRISMPELAEYYGDWGNTTDFFEDWMLTLEKSK